MRAMAVHTGWRIGVALRESLEVHSIEQPAVLRKMALLADLVVGQVHGAPIGEFPGGMRYFGDVTVAIDARKPRMD